MGRTIPNSEVHIINPIFSILIIAAGMAAAIAIISGLCGIRYRKKSISSPSLSSSSQSPASLANLDNNKDIIFTLPPPNCSSFSFSHHNVELCEKKAQDKDKESNPMKRAMRGTYSFKELRKTITTGSSTKRVTRSLSLMARSQVKDEDVSTTTINSGNKKGKRKMEHQDSIWMKTIILGEKCRVSDEEEEAVIYERKGKKITAYHPRTGSSLSISRQSSFIDQDALVSSSLQDHKQI